MEKHTKSDRLMHRACADCKTGMLLVSDPVIAGIRNTWLPHVHLDFKTTKLYTIRLYYPNRLQMLKRV